MWDDRGGGGRCISGGGAARTIRAKFHHHVKLRRVKRPRAAEELDDIRVAQREIELALLLELRGASRRAFRFCLATQGRRSRRRPTISRYTALIRLRLSFFTATGVPFHRASDTSPNEPIPRWRSKASSVCSMRIRLSESFTAPSPNAEWSAAASFAVGASTEPRRGSEPAAAADSADDDGCAAVDGGGGAAAAPAPPAAAFGARRRQKQQ